MSDAPRPAFGNGDHETPSAAPWSGAGDGWKPLREALPRIGGDAPSEPTMPSGPPEPTYEKGLAEGMEKAKQAITGIVERYQKSLVELTQTRENVLQETEADLVRLALHIAGQIVVGDVEARLGFTQRMVHHALRLLGEADAVTLRISSADMSGLMAKEPQLMGMGHVTLVEDEHMALGGVIAECNLGRVDATLERRLAEMGALLMGEEPGAP